MSEDSLIGFDDGYRVIKNDGLTPFVETVESGGKGKVKAANYVKIYDMIFKMCIQRGPYNFSDKLYKKYEEEIQTYCTSAVRAGLTDAKRKPDVQFLQEWNKRWKNHKLIVEGDARFFTYLDRFHTANNDLILPLREKGFEIFHNHIFQQFAPQARDCILKLIENERREEDVDRELLREAVLAFVEMGTNYNQQKLTIYKEQLEKKIIEHAQAFYKRTSRSWMAQDSAPNYLKKAEKMLAQEKARVDAYLNRNTHEPLRNACYVEILKNHQGPLLDKKTGIDSMLANNSTDDLARLYRVYNMKDFKVDLTPISQKFHDYIAAEGKRLVSEAQESGTANDANNGLVSKLIALHDRFEVVVSECFEKSTIFQKSLKRAFETFINEDERVSNLLAEYVHEVLRKGSKVNIQAADLDNTLNNIAYLYLYIHDKDVFERSHQVFLKKRLLSGECANEHSEKSMIAKLKHGNFQWTNKLEGMFKDIQLSKEMIKSFLQGDGKNVAANIKLDVNVCTTANWPRPESNDRAKIPPELKRICECYTEFYTREHKGHKLDWRYEQGTSEVLVNFRTGMRRTLVCSTYHMIILLLFNQAKEEQKYALEYRTILDLMDLQDSWISHHVLSLCHPKVGVLQKMPMSPTTLETDLLRINPNFKNNMQRVVIKTMTPPKVIQKTQLEEEKRRTIRRKNQMDAAIVRIMKARKKMKHSALVQETISQLQHRFRPKPQNVKMRIEALIDQEYLKRADDDRGTYQYLA